MYPALLRVGFASALAYRAEFLIWVLTTNLPLINLALWVAVSRDAPVAGFTTTDFAAYFLATLVVRQLTGSWVVWELTMDVRQGTLGMRLLRPLHPLLAYSAENLAALPMRALICSPIVALLLWVAGGSLTGDPVILASVPLLVLGAWTLTFVVMAIIGSLAFFVESAGALFEVWLGLFTVFSGYLVPLELFPPWLQAIARWLPFRLLLGVPVEALLGRLSLAELLLAFVEQLAWIAGALLVLRASWSAGVRRFAAFGG
jgi:ABC-2 type transport system permease protein